MLCTLHRNRAKNALAVLFTCYFLEIILFVLRVILMKKIFLYIVKWYSLSNDNKYILEENLEYKYCAAYFLKLFQLFFILASFYLDYGSLSF